MATYRVVAGLFLLALLAVPSAWAAEEKEQDEKVALDQAPAAVLKAAQDAVKGITLTEAERETKGAAVVYELKGNVGDKEYEVQVSADGKVLKVEEEKGDKEEEKGEVEKGEKE
jgi:hypothetical protein